eukprot:CAMPEP_0197177332 /NCGR_PEP_ID=MMETSP1423-20130617/2975_1 /TAXON_ID=476441 /ORGANISM="Pseudo-nitzschia heimii, Strain UNC1101" /LENGTH=59 /DNA_ID=CAMNT_0042626859 /DNA_START=22 /DNA_END=197 /DNA_ORIENTATION=-
MSETMLTEIASVIAIVLGLVFLVLKNRKKTVLPLDDFRRFPLIRKTVLSHDTAEFVFGL